MVHSLETGIFLSSWFLDSVSVVLGVLIFRRVIFVFGHLEIIIITNLYEIIILN